MKNVSDIDKGEACFASSGTNIRVISKNEVSFITGGLSSNLYIQDKKINLPIIQGKETGDVPTMTGIMATGTGIIMMGMMIEMMNQMMITTAIITIKKQNIIMAMDMVENWVIIKTMNNYKKIIPMIAASFWRRFYFVYDVKSWE